MNNITIISRDCIGGMVYHQLGWKFCSPTINLFFTPEDFNLFCLNLRSYIDGRLVEVKYTTANYPVGILYPYDYFLRPIYINFMHYTSFQEAANKWEERKQRINWNNIRVVSSFCYNGEISTWTPELVKQWNQIPYKKVVFVQESYGFDDEYMIRKPVECNEYAWLLSPIAVNKYVFNQFDFSNFLK